MTNYDLQIMKEFLRKGQNAPNPTEKGQALEDLVCYLFLKLKGIEVYETNVMNFYQTQEIDIVLWNEQSENTLRSLPSVIFIECKNLSYRVNDRDVSFFITKLRSRALTFGILIASFGITGTEDRSNAAHFEVPITLSDGIRLIVITINDIIHLSNTNDLIQLIKKKILRLYVKGSIEF